MSMQRRRAAAALFLLALSLAVAALLMWTHADETAAKNNPYLEGRALALGEEFHPEQPNHTPAVVVLVGAGLAALSTVIVLATNPGQEPTPASPPGWHPDPGGSGQQRWWDGTNWTDHLH